jgi:4,5-DOPA dioxygenase extradiol
MCTDARYIRLMSIFHPASLPATAKMPVLFIGHGSPMHAIEESDFSRAWGEMGAQLPSPTAILVISAHWMTRGVSLVHIGARPRTIHDFGGFPRALHEVQYPAPGAPEAAAITLDLLRDHHAEADAEWGLDHGVWCVLLRMFPKADVPVYQLSLDLSRPLKEHMALAAELRALRERGVLIVGSGNAVHNLPAMRQGATAFDWALDFDTMVGEAITKRDYGKLAELNPADPLMRIAHPSIEHFLPLLYTLGAAEVEDKPTFFAEGFDLGSISMRSVVMG